MNKNIVTALFILLTISGNQLLWAQGALIKVKMNNYQEKELYLAYRLGSKTYIADTADTKDNNGYFIFQRSKKYHQGLYMIVTKPDNNFFEFIMPAQQQFSIESTVAKQMEWSVNGSVENQQFLTYLKSMNLLMKKKDTVQANSNAEAALIKQMIALQNQIIKQQPGNFFANLIRATKEPVIPKTLKGDAAFYYYRTHYFDELALQDNRLLYSSKIEDKLEYYLEKLTTQEYDSVIAAVELIIGKVKKAGDKEVYQFVLSYLLNKYAKTKTVCFDNVYVHIGQHYYCSQPAPSWIDKTQLEKICDNVEALRFSGCGSVAPAVNLVNAVTNESINLFAVKTAYTILFFWTPDAIKSDNELNDLKKLYAVQKNKGITVIGICAASPSKTKETVQSFAVPWPTGSASGDELKWLESKYAIKSYPAIYVLDKEKKIVYKKIDVSTLATVLKSLLK